jgi:hypothetical protein
MFHRRAHSNFESKFFSFPLKIVSKSEKRLKSNPLVKPKCTSKVIFFPLTSTDVEQMHSKQSKTIGSSTKWFNVVLTSQHRTYAMLLYVVQFVITDSEYQRIKTR